MLTDLGFLEIILRLADVERDGLLLEKQPDTVSAQLATVVHQQRLMDASLREGLVSAPLRVERFGQKRIVR
jgi:hypothetical protein